MSEILQGSWKIVTISEELPDDGFVKNNEHLASEVMHNYFEEHLVVKRQQRHQRSTKELRMCHFDNGQSLFVFHTQDY